MFEKITNFVINLVPNFVENLFVKFYNIFFNIFYTENSQKFITDKNYIPSINITELSILKKHDIENNLGERKYIYELRDSIKLVLEDIFLNKGTEIIIDEDIINEYSSDKIFVEFTLNNDTYFMCINDLRNFKKIEHVKKSNLSRRIISATLISNEKNEKNEDVLLLINKYHGPDYNFYNNLSGVSNKFVDIFVDYELSEYKSLVIDDLFGDTHIYDIRLKDHIDWRTHSTF